jgi:transcription-repair coupling factor (superfamily II helicase)
MNSIRISDCYQVGIEKLVMKQGKMICYFVINNLIIINRNVLERFCILFKKHTDICKMKEKQTPNGLRSINFR